MKCEIKWNVLSLSEWQAYFDQIPRSNFLQSYDYALGACRYYRQKARWGLIHIEGKPAGLVQMFEAGFLFKAFHAVIIDRGPLWFDGFGGAAHVQAFVSEINAQFPRRFGRKRRFLLEIEDSPAAKALLKQAGLEFHANLSPYDTFMLDLTPSIDDLRANFNQKWRNSLVNGENNAQKSNSTVKWDQKGALYSQIKRKYAQDKANRGYGGISPQFLDILAPFVIHSNNMLIGEMRSEDAVIASVMFIKHGNSATYQIGVSSIEGRDAKAHHLLLWQGINMLKLQGVQTLDLGGINDDTAQGVKKFKQGMGGRPYRLVGHYS